MDHIIDGLKDLNTEAFDLLKDNLDFFFGNYQTIIMFIRNKQVESLSKLLLGKSGINMQNIKAPRLSLAYFNTDSIRKMITEKINDYRKYFDEEKFNRTLSVEKREVLSPIKREIKKAQSTDERASRQKSEKDDDVIIREKFLIY